MNKEKWNNLRYAAQVLNIVSEVSRAIRCKNKILLQEGRT